MKIRSRFWLIALSGLLMILTACQVQSFPGGTASVASVPAGESLYIIDGYSSTNNSSAGQRIVAFQPT
ncbi:MAG TPA: hypothetical protein VKU38_15350, partial [Ktedonobacteraceae bacterium]|nr:hypothetical protein [Ktedonobacteraceae bacterium]